jgi:hypothetical protein
LQRIQSKHSLIRKEEISKELDFMRKKWENMTQEKLKDKMKIKYYSCDGTWRFS